MSDKASHRGPAASRKFAPDVNALESRLLLSQSQKVSFPDGSSSVFPLFKTLPNKGGVFVQDGSVVSIGVGQPTTNAAHVTDDGAGNDTVEWNGGPVHSLTGVDSTLIETRRAKANQITINLTSPGTSPAAVAVGAIVPTDAARASDVEHPREFLMKRRTGGVAIQTGSVLTITVDLPTINAVAITNDGGGAVAVEWTIAATPGRSPVALIPCCPVHAFTGVDTIVVDTQSAKKDFVAIDDAGPCCPRGGS